MSNALAFFLRTVISLKIVYSEVKRFNVSNLLLDILLLQALGYI